jgi:hypothetical protein
MRLLKFFLLFISIFFLTTVGSVRQAFGIHTERVNSKHFQYNKAEPNCISFINLLCEETDTSEDEDNSHEVSILHLPQSSEFTYPHVGAIALANAHLTYAKVNHNSTPLFIQFRNIRL